MRRLGTLIFGMLLGGGLVYTSYQYHVVRTGDQFLVIPKLSPTLVDPYVDIRDWTAEDWRRHVKLAEALIAQGHERLLTQGGLVGPGSSDKSPKPDDQPGGGPFEPYRGQLPSTRSSEGDRAAPRR